MSYDPHLLSRSLLLSCDGADNGTVFTDRFGHAVTASAQTKTGIRKYGSASAYFNGSGMRMASPSAPEFNLGDGDFTVEMWAYFLNGGHGGTWARLLQIGDNSTPGGFWLACVNMENPARLFIDGWRSSYVRLCTEPAATVSNDTWHHIAAVKHGGAYTIYLDGEVYASQTPDPYTHVQGPVYIGANQSSVEGFYGYLDEIRISRRAEYTAPFTPPPGPFPYFDKARLAIPQQAAIVRMINPYTLDGRMQPRITTVPASFRSGLGTITGMIAEDTPFARWSLSVLDAVTGEKLSQTESTGSSYTVRAPKGRPVLVSCAPVIDGVWMASYLAAPGEIIVARSPGDTPYAYRCTTGGATGAEEPEWGTTPGGTTADGSAVWTCLARLVQPRMQGPLLAA